METIFLLQKKLIFWALLNCVTISQATKSQATMAQATMAQATMAQATMSQATMSHVDIISKAFDVVFLQVYKPYMKELNELAETKDFDVREFAEKIDEFAKRIAPEVEHNMLLFLPVPEFDTFDDAKETFNRTIDLFDSVTAFLAHIVAPKFNLASGKELQEQKVSDVFGELLLVHVRECMDSALEGFQMRLIESYNKSQNNDQEMEAALDGCLERYANYCE